MSWHSVNLPSGCKVLTGSVLLDLLDVPMETTVPDDRQCEMKRKKLTLSLIAMETQLSHIIGPGRHSSSRHLSRVTALLLKFISCLHERVGHAGPLPQSSISLTQSNLDKAKLYWIKDSQSHLEEDKRFPTWRRQLSLYMDRDGVRRCGGRMSKSCLSVTEQNTSLIVSFLKFTSHCDK